MSPTIVHAPTESKFYNIDIFCYSAQYMSVTERFGILFTFDIVAFAYTLNSCNFCVNTI